MFAVLLLFAGSAVAQEWRVYQGARTVIDMPPADLTEQYPELNRLQFAQEQTRLAELLHRVGQRVETFLQTISNIGAVESVDQDCESKLVKYRHASHYKYLYMIYPRQNGSKTEVEEFRSDSKGASMEKGRMKQPSCLVTSGFVSQSLFFHPRNREEVSFRLLGTMMGKSQPWVIAFAQKPEKATMTGGFGIGSIEVLLLLQGLAWIDPETMVITRLHTDLLAPRDDVKLTRHRTEILYSDGGLPVDGNRIWWLPKEVQVDIQWNRWRFRNRHSYKDYKLFSVETREGGKQILKPL